MPNAADIAWFKQTYGPQVTTALAGTPFDLDMLTALACQETGEIWPALRRKGLPPDQILALCAGDTLDDTAGRKAFPKNKAALIATPEGARMFPIARQALVDMAAQIPAYAKVAKNPNKFCHGYGIFQYDLQFLKTNPAYFLEGGYKRLDVCAGRAVAELKEALKTLGWQAKVQLTDLEMAAVAIAYNTGGYNPAKGLKQGHRNDQGRWYGELFFDFLRLARTVATPNAAAVLPKPVAGQAIVAAPSPVTAGGPAFVVDTQEGPLNLRSAPDRTQKNVKAQLPDGHPVRALTGQSVNGFVEVETTLSGALLRGFVWQAYLKPSDPVPLTPLTPAPKPPRSGVVAAHMPRKAGSITTRAAPAGAHSLNETGQPGRKGTAPEALRAELAAIIAWLAVDDPAHRRYQPGNGQTFCNIYAHDYCHLAGVYLPRVWWTAPAIVALSKGKAVAPLYGDTIEEMRANALFRWLRDFGPDFGWRQTGTATKLQQEVNQGAVGLIIARRKIEGRSGHVAMVVPETDAQRAKRDAQGEVTAPLQSQAGAVNFRYGTSKAGWWTDEATFAESAFWLHA